MTARAYPAFAIAIAAFLCATEPAFAGPAPAIGGDANVAVMNQRLATLVTAAQPLQTKAVAAAPRAAGARFANVTQARPIHLAPFLLELAGRYNETERLLHYRSHGFDANFWGAVGRGRIKFSYGVKF